jgi:hypothetical protein
MWAWFGPLLLGTLLGALGGWLLAKWESVAAGFAALGAATGLMIGLSSSPIVAATVSSLIGLIGLVLPLYSQKQVPAPQTSTTDQAAAPRLGSWLFPFGLALLTATLVGVALRANDALNFSSPNLREHYAAQGFTKDQIDLIMNQFAKALGATPAPVKPPDTVLHTISRPSNWNDIWTANYKATDTPEVNLARIEAASPTAVKDAILTLRSQQVPAADILSALQSRFSK